MSAARSRSCIKLQLSSKLKRNLIDVSVADKNILALVDSGSTISCLSKDFINNTQYVDAIDSSTNVGSIRTAVGTNKYTVAGKVKLFISIDGLVFEQLFYIIPGLTQDIILGLDFLSNQNASVNFGEGTITFLNYNKCLNLKTHVQHAVRAIKSIKLTPGYHTLPVGVESNFQKGDILVEPSQIIKKWGGTNAILRSTNNVLHMPIYNHDKFVRKIKPGTIIAFATPINSTDIFNINVQEDTSFNISNDNLSGEQNKVLNNFLNSSVEMFANDLTELSPTNVLEHKIEIVPGASPIQCRPYKSNPKTNEIIKEELDKMLKAGIISESMSPWQFPLVCVKKKMAANTSDFQGEGADTKQSYRVCTDFRLLNRITKPQYFYSQTLEDFIDILAESNCSIYSQIDLKGAYYVVPLEQSAKEMCSFSTIYGTYSYNRMAMGLRNAAFTFSKLMVQVLKGLVNKICLVYQDDILVFSRNFDEHIHHLRLIFDRLKEANIRMNPKKCSFALKEVKFLGFILGCNEIKMDEDKINIIKNYQPPKNVKHLRSFLGMTSYLRKFIKNYACITQPLNQLLKKNAKYVWGKEQHSAFETLKRELTGDVMLQFPKFSRPFYLHTDASTQGLGYILMQKDDAGKERVVRYGGRALRGPETRYSATEIECLAIVDAVKEYRSYLQFSKVYIYSDHNCLKYLNKFKMNNPRLYRWSLELESYDYEIFYGPGNKNIADNLSRVFEKNEINQENNNQNCESNNNEPENALEGSFLTEIYQTDGNCKQMYQIEIEYCLDQHVSVLTRAQRHKQIDSNCPTTNTTPTEHPASDSGNTNNCNGEANNHSSVQTRVQHGDPKLQTGQHIPDFGATKCADDIGICLPHDIFSSPPALHPRSEGDISEPHLQLRKEGGGDGVGAHQSDNHHRQPDSLVQPTTTGYQLGSEPTGLHDNERVPGKSREPTGRSHSPAHGLSPNRDMTSDELRHDASMQHDYDSDTPINKLQLNSPDFADLYKFLHSDILPEDKNLAKNIIYKSSQYELIDGVLYHIFESRGRNKTKQDRIIKQLALPEILRPEILHNYHDKAGHFGEDRVYATLRLKYWFPGMMNYVRKWIKSCEACQINKRDIHQKPAELTPLETPSDTFERLHMDILTNLPKTKEGYNHILLVVDYFSKFPFIFPLKTQTAEEIADVLYNKVITYIGAPKSLLSDRGQNFLSGIVKILCKYLNIKQYRTSAYHPMTNSACERTNSVIAQMLRMYVNKDQENWAELLPTISMCYRASVSTESTKYSPFYILYGKEMNLAIDTLYDLPPSQPKNIKLYAEQLSKKMQVVKDIVHENIKAAKEKMKTRYDVKATNKKLKVGTAVYIKVGMVPVGKSKKLHNKYEGKYYVSKCLKNNTYLLRSLDGHKELKTPIHFNRLKVCYDGRDIRPLIKFNNANMEQDDTSNKGKANETIPTCEPKISNNKWYPAVKILKEKKINGTKHYLVQWKNKRFKPSWQKCSDVSDLLVKRFYINKTKLRQKRQPNNRQR